MNGNECFHQKAEQVRKQLDDESKLVIDSRIAQRLQGALEPLQRSTKAIKRIRHNPLRTGRTELTELVQLISDIKSLPEEWSKVEKEKIMINNEKIVSNAQLNALQSGMKVAENYKNALEEKIETDAELQAEQEFQEWRKQYEAEHPKAREKYLRAKNGFDRD